LEEIQKVAGFSVSVEVDWASLAAKDWEHMYEKDLPRIYFTPLIEALKHAGSDEVGKKALKDNLKAIEIQNTGQYSNPTGISFEDGTLILDHDFANADDVDNRTEHLMVRKKWGTTSRLLKVEYNIY
jgi:hypothetical protein